MAQALKLKSGTKLAVAFDVPVGKDPDFSLVSSFFKPLGDSSFLMSIPMKSGKSMTISDDQKLLIRYGDGAEQNIIAGYVDETVKQGIRSYWKLRRVTEKRTFFQRADERVKISMHVAYSQPTWHANLDGIIEPEDGLTLDISGGGMAMYLNDYFEVGEICTVTLPPMGTSKAGKPITLLAENCWTRKAEKRSPYKNICGLKFNYKDQRDKKRVADYIENMKKYTS
ncbi:MAG: PilZ domain-containing protein [Ruminococcaceae bacterium]|nr:PilZ domain-containing protein [Oscillospiraceae bacterium]